MSFISRMFTWIGIRDLPTAIGANLIFYSIYLCTKTNCWVDFGWAFNQWAISSILFFTNPISVATAIPYSIITLWGFRLAGHLVVNRICHKHTDERYSKLVKRSKIGKEWKYYLFQYLLQAFIVFFPLSPVYLIFMRPMTPTPLFYFGGLLALYGVFCEAKADMDLEKYKKMKKKGLLKEKSLCDFGHWKYSRHPNIFFEVMTWTGISLMGFHPSHKLLNLICFLGPVSLFLIVRYLTLPLTESCMRKKRSNWDQILKETNLLFPYWVNKSS